MSVLNTCSARCVRSFALIFISWVHGLRQQFTRITIYLYATFTSPTVYSTLTLRRHECIHECRKEEAAKRQKTKTFHSYQLFVSTVSSVNINDSRSRFNRENENRDGTRHEHDCNTWTYELSFVSNTFARRAAKPYVRTDLYDWSQIFDSIRGTSNVMINQRTNSHDWMAWAKWISIEIIKYKKSIALNT